METILQLIGTDGKAIELSVLDQTELDSFVTFLIERNRVAMDWGFEELHEKLAEHIGDILVDAVPIFVDFIDVDYSELRTLRLWWAGVPIDVTLDSSKPDGYVTRKPDRGIN